jgi:hypothetical protein
VPRVDLPPPPSLPNTPAEEAVAPNKAGPVITLIGGVLVAVGSLMPWATVTHAFGTLTVNGTEGDGRITLVVGLILVLVAVLELAGTVSGRNVARDIALILAFVAAGIGVYQIVNLESRLGDVRSEFARASVGMGLYSVVGGGVLGVVGGFLKR